MKLTHANVVALLSAGAGGAAAGAALASGGAPLLVSASGALAFAATALQLGFISRTVGAERRFRAWCADASSDVAPLPGLSEPFRSCAAAARGRIEALAAEAGARQSEARRARVAARSLQVEHDLLRSLLEGLSDGVILVGEGGAATFVNRAARGFLDLAEDAPLACDARELASAPPLKAAIEEGLKGEGRASRSRRDVDCSDQAQRRVLRISFQEVAAADGNGGGSLAILLSDVTREVEINRMKSDFASSVSHELKTPLASMRAFLEMLLDGDIEGEEERREHLRLVLDETQRLSQLVQNLLNLARLEAGITRMERKPVALVDLLEHLRDVVTPLAASRKQTIVFDVSEFTPAVTGDRNLLEQAVMNLVSNAIKYTPEGGSIRVRAGLAGALAELVVSDDGVGIPEKALDLVFEKFTRVENSAGLKATGTGLGLPLARFVARAHGGSISVTSQVGKGSEFRMLLPVRRGEESSESQLVALEAITG
ncbi:MAG: hypothetical protein HY812_15765 [Planctomycetes bacterium]|nr:hypothetical protein [Planctomycetota bacterium]